jgi:hypothetical protein
MTKHVLALAAALCLAVVTTSAFAASNQEQCREIIARAETSKEAQLHAALLYFHGMVMGERCTNIKVDYVKSLTMLKALGRTAEYNSLATTLKSRAASGNPKAKAALQKLGIPLD